MTASRWFRPSSSQCNILRRPRLDLEFQSGAVHRYFTVPRAIVEGLRTAESKGAYFNRHIKDQFPSRPLI